MERRRRVCYWRRLAGTRRLSTLSAALLSRARRRRRRRLARKDANGTTEEGEWKKLGIPVPVIRALLEQGIHTPTEIQRRAITAALREQCDIIGAAETGSGKTLAFAIPILHHLLTTGAQPVARKEEEEEEECRAPSFMTRTPTVEINSYDKSVGRSVVDLNTVIELKEGEEGGEETPSMEEALADPATSDEEECTLITYQDNIPDEEFQQMLGGGGGGEEQKRTNGGRGLLTALILTPTRELALQVKDHIAAVTKYTSVKVCAVVGGMAVEKQVRLLNQHPQIVVATPGRLWKLIKEEEHHHLCVLQQLQFLVLDEADRMIEHGHFVELSLLVERVMAMRPTSSKTFVFSATLTLPRRRIGRGRQRSVSRQQTLESLMSQLGLSDTTLVIDLTSSQGTVETLTESKVMCSQDDKDLYLYFFLLAYPGRTLVFVNSVNCLHRLHSLLNLLQLRPLSLHAGMQQRQRLKNLDRFVSNSESVMVASDVAARGLDIPHVQHVVHYQLPRNTEVYVHRSGRTARGRREGLSVILVGPSDIQAYRNICRTLNKDKELISFPVDSRFLKPLRSRLQLARKIELGELRLERKRRSRQWMEQTAKAMDILLDEDLNAGREEEDLVAKQQQQTIKAMRAELSRLLSKAAIPSGVSLSFPASSGETSTLDQLLVDPSSVMSQGCDALTAVKRIKTSIKK